MYLAVQAGAFSDNYVLSMPAEFGIRILLSAAALRIKLLQLGFLTRGGVTVGQMYHIDNVVFGPALIEAVALEKEAHYPRLLCSDGLLAHVADAERYVIEDQLGRKIVNPFVPIAKVAGRSVRDFHNEVWGIPGIERTIEAELKHYSAAKLHRYAENWRYMRDVLPLMLQGLDESRPFVSSQYRAIAIANREDTSRAMPFTGQLSHRLRRLLRTHRDNDMGAWKNKNRGAVEVPSAGTTGAAALRAHDVEPG